MGDVPVAGNDAVFHHHHANIDRLQQSTDFALWINTAAELRANSPGRDPRPRSRTVKSMAPRGSNTASSQWASLDSAAR
jgi:hypothetical protein